MIGHLQSLSGQLSTNELHNSYFISKPQSTLVVALSQPVGLAQVYSAAPHFRRREPTSARHWPATFGEQFSAPILSIAERDDDDEDEDESWEQDNSIIGLSCPVCLSVCVASIVLAKQTSIARPLPGAFTLP